MTARYRRAFAVVCAGLLVSSCFSGDTGDPRLRGFAELRERVLAHEDAIAACMRAEGFDYVATAPVELLLQQAWVEAEVAGRDADEARQEVERNLPPDPNAEIVSGLSEAERVAYQEAYWGPDGDEAAGCYYRTYEGVWGTDLLQDDPEVDRTIARLRADPELLAAERDVLECMRGRGFPVRDMDDVFRQRDLRSEQADSEEELAAVDAWYEAALEAYDACREPYLDLYDELYIEYFEGRR